MPFSQIIPLSPSPTGSKRLFYTSVSLFYLSYRVLDRSTNSFLTKEKAQGGYLYFLFFFFYFPII